MCRPILVDDVPSPFLKIVGGVNICVQGALGGADCIPNDIVLGTPPDTNASDSQALSPLMLLVTGPNMGGKSTLLRQACLTALMAHLGCHVPAQQCSLSPVDRIFTRVGANDAIMARALSSPAASCCSKLPSAPSFASPHPQPHPDFSQAGLSTFRVELEETAAIVKHSTASSIVILDELGRGTATFDGMAIAHAVLSHLIEHTQCRSLFATHYHALTREFEAANPKASRRSSSTALACISPTLSFGSAPLTLAL